MNEIKSLRRQVKYDNLTYYFKNNNKNKNFPKRFVRFRSPLGFYINIKYGCTTPKSKKSKRIQSSCKHNIKRKTRTSIRREKKCNTEYKKASWNTVKRYQIV